MILVTLIVIVGSYWYYTTEMKKLERMKNKSFSFASQTHVDEQCPWYIINTLTGNCSCKEYTKRASRLVLVDDNCLEHGCDKKVDSSSQVKDNEHCST